jgi:hypothetical protein
MVVRNLPIVAVLILAAATPLWGQELPNPQRPEFQALQMQLQIQTILMTRSPESEAAGRDWLQKIAPDLMRALDSLNQASHDQYWTEIAQLAAQQGMVSNILYNKDSGRADVVTRMFGLEARARAQQRAYRTASAANRPAIRAQLEALMAQHFDLEDRLRALEVADIERRLAEVRAENQRRRDNRSEFIKFAVDDIIRDAVRPR